MSQNQVVDKLSLFLTNPEQNCSNEQGVMYLMVELRKLIAFSTESVSNLKMVKFYCDWCVHTTKDQNFNDIREVLDSAYNACLENYKNPSAVSEVNIFIGTLLFIELRKNMILLFNEYGLSSDLFFNVRAWAFFTKSLLKILSDQPITCPPTYPISKVEIVYADGNDDVLLELTFRNPIIDQAKVVHNTYQKTINFPPFTSE